MLAASWLTDVHKKSPAESWCSPPRLTMLRCEEVHIWRAALYREVSDVQGLLSTLTEDEQARARCFHFQRDRERFIIARGLLREILGRYLGAAPGQLQFCYGIHGKPALAGRYGTGDLRFNLTHSYGLTLLAVTRGREIGIDMERIRVDFPCLEIADRFFSPREAAALRTLPVEHRDRAFFTCWTRKEAYLKAKGDGLAASLAQFDVSLAPTEPAALLRTEEDPQEACRWSVQELAPGPGYVASLVVEGCSWQLRCWRWPA